MSRKFIAVLCCVLASGQPCVADDAKPSSRNSNSQGAVDEVGTGARKLEVDDVDGTPAPEWLGEFTTLEDVVARSREARAWLEQHPRHNYALHVAERLYFAARREGNIPLADFVREFVVVHWEKTAFQAFLARDFDKEANGPHDWRLWSYAKRRLFPGDAGGGGAGEFGADALRFAPARIEPPLRVVSNALEAEAPGCMTWKDKQFLELHLAVTIVPVPFARRMCVRVLGESPRHVERLARTVSDDSRPVLARFAELEACRSPEHVSIIELYQDHLYRKLTTAERETAVAVSIRAERLVEKQRYVEAVEALRRLCEIEATTRRRFLLGWCLHCSGDKEEALSILERLIDAKNGTTDPWRVMAKSATDALRDEKDARPLLLAEFDRVLGRFRTQPKQLMVRLAGSSSGRSRLSAYMLLDRSEGRLRAGVHRDGRNVLMYDASANHHALRFEAEPDLSWYGGTGAFPSFFVGPAQPQEEASVEMRFQTVGTPNQIFRDLDDVAKQPGFAGAVAIAQSLGKLFRGRIVRVVPSNAVDGRAFEVLSPDLRRAEWNPLRWIVSADGNAMRIEAKEFTVELDAAPGRSIPEIVEASTVPVRRVEGHGSDRILRATSLSMSLLSELVGDRTEETAIVPGEVIRR